MLLILILSSAIFGYMGVIETLKQINDDLILINRNIGQYLDGFGDQRGECAKELLTILDNSELKKPVSENMATFFGAAANAFSEITKCIKRWSPPLSVLPISTVTLPLSKDHVGPCVPERLVTVGSLLRLLEGNSKKKALDSQDVDLPQYDFDGGSPTSSKGSVSLSEVLGKWDNVSPCSLCSRSSSRPTHSVSSRCSRASRPSCRSIPRRRTVRRVVVHHVVLISHVQNEGTQSLTVNGLLDSVRRLASRGRSLTKRFLQNFL